MSAADQFEQDIEDAFLSTDDFAVTATYTNRFNQTESINLIFDTEYQASDVFTLEVANVAPSCRCQTSKVTEIRVNERLTIKGVVYFVQSIEPIKPDGLMTRLTLSRDKAHG